MIRAAADGLLYESFFLGLALKRTLVLANLWSPVLFRGLGESVDFVLTVLQAHSSALPADGSGPNVADRVYHRQKGISLGRP